MLEFFLETVVCAVVLAVSWVMAFVVGDDLNGAVVVYTLYTDNGT